MKLWRINILNIGNKVQTLRILLALDPGSRMEKFGSGINIPDP
jgi:hypothetical protein